ncbi:MAG: glycosyltransferase family 2 protein [Armatimonadota bacterium]
MGIPLFSVILPTYDRPELLRLAVQSLLAQTVADFKAIVVDDGARRSSSLTTPACASCGAPPTTDPRLPATPGSPSRGGGM